MTLPKSWKLYAAIAGIAVLTSLILGARSCHYKGRVAALEAQRIEAEHIAAANAEIHGKLIAGLNAEIQRQDILIKASQKAVADLNANLGAQDTQIAALNQSLANAQSDAERVPILTAQVKAWSDKFTLAQGIIAEQEKQLAAWGVKYADAIKIGESWKAQYEGQSRLYEIAKSEISALKGQLRTAGITGKIKTGLVLTAAGVVAYTLIKGAAK